MNKIKLLTANQHDTDGKDFLWVGVWRHVSKSYTCQTAEGKIKCCNIFVLDGWSRACITLVVMLS